MKFDLTQVTPSDAAKRAKLLALSSKKNDHNFRTDFPNVIRIILQCNTIKKKENIK